MTRAKPVRGRRRVPLMVRTTAALRARLEAEVLQTGRSLGQEAELRLEASFRQSTVLDEVRAIIRDELRVALAAEPRAPHPLDRLRRYEFARRLEKVDHA